mmetsp:Transcript_427/g.605  ORF Transcript_427/g.605 Transcript_427/m.605 type:complete len:100 (-) Transcript_427:82-381(-)
MLFFLVGGGDSVDGDSVDGDDADATLEMFTPWDNRNSSTSVEQPTLLSFNDSVLLLFWSASIATTSRQASLCVCIAVVVVAVVVVVVIVTVLLLSFLLL